MLMSGRNYTLKQERPPMNTDTKPKAGAEPGADRFWREPDFKWWRLPRTGREWVPTGIALLAAYASLWLHLVVSEALPEFWSFLWSVFFICGIFVLCYLMVTRWYRRIRDSKLSRWIRGEERPHQQRQRNTEAGRVAQ